MNIKQRLLETRSMIYDVFNVGKPSTPSTARNYDAAGYIQYQTLTSWSNIINGFTGNSPVSDSYVRSVIHCIANYATKLQMQHIIRMPDGRYDVIDDDITYMLNHRPNKYMTAAMFNYKIFAQLLMSNNAFVYPQYDDAGNLRGLWPLSFDNATMLQDKNTGEMAVAFSFLGSQILVPYDNVIHLRNQFSGNDLMGDSQDDALNEIVNQSAVLRQARDNLLQANGTAQFVLKANGALKQTDIDKAVETFVNSYGMKHRIAAIDNKLDVTPVTSQCIQVSNEDIIQGKKDILTYFGVSEAILTGDFSEQQLEAFLEHKIQPFALQMGQELEYKLLSDRRINRGHEIIYNVNTLLCASVQTRVDMCEKLVNIGLMSCNEGRKILGMQMRDEVEADELRVSLNTVNLKTAKAYQLGRAGVDAATTGKEEESNNGGE